MEINPRLYYSLGIAIGAGADIPYHLYLATIGEKNKGFSIASYKTGVKSRFLTWPTQICEHPILIACRKTGGFKNAVMAIARIDG